MLIIELAFPHDFLQKFSGLSPFNLSIRESNDQKWKIVWNPTLISDIEIRIDIKFDK